MYFGTLDQKLAQNEFQIAYGDVTLIIDIEGTFLKVELCSPTQQAPLTSNFPTLTSLFLLPILLNVWKRDAKVPSSISAVATLPRSIANVALSIRQRSRSNPITPTHHTQSWRKSRLITRDSDRYQAQ